MSVEQLRGLAEELLCQRKCNGAENARAMRPMSSAKRQPGAGGGVDAFSGEPPLSDLARESALVQSEIQRSLPRVWRVLP